MPLEDHQISSRHKELLDQYFSSIEVRYNLSIAYNIIF